MAIEWRHWWAISCKSELEIITLPRGRASAAMAWDRDAGVPVAVIIHVNALNDIHVVDSFSPVGIVLDEMFC